MKPLPVSVDPELMSGTPCFTGTRVPLKALLDHLSDGGSMREFLTRFPTVDRAHVDAFLYLAASWMIEAARRSHEETTSDVVEGIESESDSLFAHHD
jgi:uncharacterized protein (DUF433 family)